MHLTHRRSILVAAAGLWLALCATLSAHATVDGGRAFDADPVELVLRGKEVAGRPYLTLTRDGITYSFATNENLVAFEREPERFEVQFGGACARMGPLSGACRTDIRAVHGGKLYVFASPQCRESFIKAPDALLDVDDPLPVADAPARERGRALLAQALEALGGADAVDAVRNCAEHAERTEISGGKEYLVVDDVWLGFARGASRADRLRCDQAWNASRWGHIVAEGRGAALSGDLRRPLVESQRLALEKDLGRHLLVVLRNRNAPGAIVAWTGHGELDGVAVEHVAVALDGRTTTLVIDPASGRLLALRYRGRAESAAFAELVVRLSDWRDVGAIELPFTRSVTADGKPQPGLAVAWDTIEIDAALDSALFRTFQ